MISLFKTKSTRQKKIVSPVLPDKVSCYSTIPIDTFRCSKKSRGFIQILPLFLLAAFAASVFIISRKVVLDRQEFRKQAATGTCSGAGGVCTKYSCRAGYQEAGGSCTIADTVCCKKIAEAPKPPVSPTPLRSPSPKATTTPKPTTSPDRLVDLCDRGLLPPEDCPKATPKPTGERRKPGEQTTQTNVPTQVPTESPRKRYRLDQTTRTCKPNPDGEYLSLGECSSAIAFLTPTAVVTPEPPGTGGSQVPPTVVTQKQRPSPTAHLGVNGTPVPTRSTGKIAYTPVSCKQLHGTPLYGGYFCCNGFTYQGTACPSSTTSTPEPTLPTVSATPKPPSPPGFQAYLEIEKDQTVVSRLGWSVDNECKKTVQNGTYRSLAACFAALGDRRRGKPAPTEAVTQPSSATTSLSSTPTVVQSSQTCAGEVRLGACARYGTYQWVRCMQTQQYSWPTFVPDQGCAQVVQLTVTVEGQQVVLPVQLTQETKELGNFIACQNAALSGERCFDGTVYGQCTTAPGGKKNICTCDPSRGTRYPTKKDVGDEVECGSLPLAAQQAVDTYVSQHVVLPQTPASPGDQQSSAGLALASVTCSGGFLHEQPNGSDQICKCSVSATGIVPNSCRFEQQATQVCGTRSEGESWVDGGMCYTCLERSGTGTIYGEQMVVQPGGEATRRVVPTRCGGVLTQTRDNISGYPTYAYTSAFQLALPGKGGGTVVLTPDRPVCAAEGCVAARVENGRIVKVTVTATGQASAYAAQCPASCAVIGAASGSYMSNSMEYRCSPDSTSVQVFGAGESKPQSEKSCPSRLCSAGKCVDGLLVIDATLGKTRICASGEVCRAIDPLTGMQVVKKVVATTGDGNTELRAENQWSSSYQAQAYNALAAQRTADFLRQQGYNQAYVDAWTRYRNNHAYPTIEGFQREQGEALIRIEPILANLGALTDELRAKIQSGEVVPTQLEASIQALTNNPFAKGVLWFNNLTHGATYRGNQLLLSAAQDYAASNCDAGLGAMTTMVFDAKCRRATIDVVRGAVLQGAAPAGMVAGVVGAVWALPITYIAGSAGLAAGGLGTAATSAVTSALLYGGQAYGVYNAVQSLQPTAQYCTPGDTANPHCRRAAFDSAAQFALVLLGGKAGDAFISTQPALTLASTRLLGMGEAAYQTTARGILNASAIRGWNITAAGVSAAYFGTKSYDVCVNGIPDESGQLVKDPVSCGQNIAMTGLSLLRVGLSAALPTTRTAVAGAVTDYGDVGVNAALVTVACGSGDVQACMQARAGLALSVGGGVQSTSHALGIGRVPTVRESPTALYEQSRERLLGLFADPANPRSGEYKPNVTPQTIAEAEGQFRQAVILRGQEYALIELALRQVETQAAEQTGIQRNLVEAQESYRRALEEYKRVANLSIDERIGKPEFLAIHEATQKLLAVASAAELEAQILATPKGRAPQDKVEAFETARAQFEDVARQKPPSDPIYNEAFNDLIAAREAILATRFNADQENLQEAIEARRQAMGEQQEHARAAQEAREFLADKLRAAVHVTQLEDRLHNVQLQRQFLGEGEVTFDRALGGWVADGSNNVPDFISSKYTYDASGQIWRSSGDNAEISAAEVAVEQNSSVQAARASLDREAGTLTTRLSITEEVVRAGEAGESAVNALRLELESRVARLGQELESASREVSVLVNAREQAGTFFGNVGRLFGRRPTAEIALARLRGPEQGARRAGTSRTTRQRMGDGIEGLFGAGRERESVITFAASYAESARVRMGIEDSLFRLGSDTSVESVSRRAVLEGELLNARKLEGERFLAYKVAREKLSANPGLRLRNLLDAISPQASRQRALIADTVGKLKDIAGVYGDIGPETRSRLTYGKDTEGRVELIPRNPNDRLPASVREEITQINTMLRRIERGMGGTIAKKGITGANDSSGRANQARIIFDAVFDGTLTPDALGVIYGFPGGAGKSSLIINSIADLMVSFGGKKVTVLANTWTDILGIKQQYSPALHDVNGVRAVYVDLQNRTVTAWDPTAKAEVTVSGKAAYEFLKKAEVIYAATGVVPYELHPSRASDPFALAFLAATAGSRPIFDEVDAALYPTRFTSTAVPRELVLARQPELAEAFESLYRSQAIEDLALLAIESKPSLAGSEIFVSRGRTYLLSDAPLAQELHRDLLVEAFRQAYDGAPVEGQSFEAFLSSRGIGDLLGDSGEIIRNLDNLLRTSTDLSPELRARISERMSMVNAMINDAGRPLGAYGESAEGYLVFRDENGRLQNTSPQDPIEALSFHTLAFHIQQSVENSAYTVSHKESAARIASAAISPQGETNTWGQILASNHFGRGLIGFSATPEPARQIAEITLGITLRTFEADKQTTIQIFGDAQNAPIRQAKFIGAPTEGDMKIGVPSDGRAVRVIITDPGAPNELYVQHVIASLRRQGFTGRIYSLNNDALAPIDRQVRVFEIDGGGNASDRYIDPSSISGAEGLTPKAVMEGELAALRELKESFVLIYELGSDRGTDVRRPNGDPLFSDHRMSKDGKRVEEYSTDPEYVIVGKTIGTADGTGVLRQGTTRTSLEQAIVRAREIPERAIVYIAGEESRVFTLAQARAIFEASEGIAAGAAGGARQNAFTEGLRAGYGDLVRANLEALRTAQKKYGVEVSVFDLWARQFEVISGINEEILPKILHGGESLEQTRQRAREFVNSLKDTPEFAALAPAVKEYYFASIFNSRNTRVNLVDQPSGMPEGKSLRVARTVDEYTSFLNASVSQEDVLQATLSRGGLESARALIDQPRRQTETAPPAGVEVVPRSMAEGNLPDVGFLKQQAGVGNFATVYAGRAVLVQAIFEATQRLSQAQTQFETLSPDTSKEDVRQARVAIDALEGLVGDVKETLRQLDRTLETSSAVIRSTVASRLSRQKDMKAAKVVLDPQSEVVDKVAAFEAKAVEIAITKNLTFEAAIHDSDIGGLYTEAVLLLQRVLQKSESEAQAILAEVSGAFVSEAVASRVQEETAPPAATTEETVVQEEAEVSRGRRAVPQALGVFLKRLVSYAVSPNPFVLFSRKAPVADRIIQPLSWVGSRIVLPIFGGPPGLAAGGALWIWDIGRVTVKATVAIVKAPISLLLKITPLKNLALGKPLERFVANERVDILFLKNVKVPQFIRNILAGSRDGYWEYLYNVTPFGIGQPDWRPWRLDYLVLDTITYVAKQVVGGGIWDGFRISRWVAEKVTGEVSPLRNYSHVATKPNYWGRDGRFMKVIPMSVINATPRRNTATWLATRIAPLFFPLTYPVVGPIWHYDLHRMYHGSFRTFWGREAQQAPQQTQQQAARQPTRLNIVTGMSRTLFPAWRHGRRGVGDWVTSRTLWLAPIPFKNVVVFGRDAIRAAKWTFSQGWKQPFDREVPSGNEFRQGVGDVWNASLWGQGWDGVGRYVSSRGMLLFPYWPRLAIVGIADGIRGLGWVLSGGWKSRFGSEQIIGTPATVQIQNATPVQSFAVGDVVDIRSSPGWRGVVVAVDRDPRFYHIRVTHKNNAAATGGQVVIRSANELAVFAPGSDLAPGIVPSGSAYRNNTGRRLIVRDVRTGKETSWNQRQELSLSDVIVFFSDTTWIWVDSKGTVKNFELRPSTKNPLDVARQFLAPDGEKYKFPDGSIVLDPEKIGPMESFDVITSERVFTFHVARTISGRSRELRGFSSQAFAKTLSWVFPATEAELGVESSLPTEILLVPGAAAQRSSASGLHPDSKDRNAMVIVLDDENLTETAGTLAHEYVHELLGGSPLYDLTEGFAVYIGHQVVPNATINSSLYTDAHVPPGAFHILGRTTPASATEISRKVESLWQEKQAAYEWTYTTGGFLVRAVAELYGREGLQKLLGVYEESTGRYESYGYDLVVTERSTGEDIRNSDALATLLREVFTGEEYGAIVDKQNVDLFDVKIASLAKDTARVEAVVGIGRHSKNKYQVSGGSVSRFHAIIIRRQDGSLTITDVASSNGTFVNGKRVEEDDVLLREGDTVLLGNKQLAHVVFHVVSVSGRLRLVESGKETDVFGKALREEPTGEGAVPVDFGITSMKLSRLFGKVVEIAPEGCSPCSQFVNDILQKFVKAATDRQSGKFAEARKELSEIERSIVEHERTPGEKNPLVFPLLRVLIQREQVALATAEGNAQAVRQAQERESAAIRTLRLAVSTLATARKLTDELILDLEEILTVLEPTAAPAAPAEGIGGGEGGGVVALHAGLTPKAVWESLAYTARKLFNFIVPQSWQARVPFVFGPGIVPASDLGTGGGGEGEGVLPASDIAGLVSTMKNRLFKEYPIPESWRRPAPSYVHALINKYPDFVWWEGLQKQLDALGQGQTITVEGEEFILLESRYSFSEEPLYGSQTPTAWYTLRRKADTSEEIVFFSHVEVPGHEGDHALSSISYTRTDQRDGIEFTRNISQSQSGPAEQRSFDVPSEYTQFTWTQFMGDSVSVAMQTSNKPFGDILDDHIIGNLFAIVWTNEKGVEGTSYEANVVAQTRAEPFMEIKHGRDGEPAKISTLIKPPNIPWLTWLKIIFPPTRQAGMRDLSLWTIARFGVVDTAIFPLGSSINAQSLNSMITKTTGDVARFTNGFDQPLTFTVIRGAGDSASRQEVTLAPGASFDFRRAEAMEIGGRTFVLMSQSGNLKFVPPIQGRMDDQTSPAPGEGIGGGGEATFTLPLDQVRTGQPRFSLVEPYVRVGPAVFFLDRKTGNIAMMPHDKTAAKPTLHVKHVQTSSLQDLYRMNEHIYHVFNRAALRDGPSEKDGNAPHGWRE